MLAHDNPTDKAIDVMAEHYGVAEADILAIAHGEHCSRPGSVVLYRKPDGPAVTYCVVRLYYGRVDGMPLRVTLLESPWLIPAYDKWEHTARPLLNAIAVKS